MLKQKAIRHVPDDCPDYLTGPAPFQNTCSIYQFYAGADRGLILDSMIEDLQATDHKLKLIGECGSGKTMLSLVFAHRLKTKYSVVRYDRALASSEQLVQHLLIEFCPQQTRQLMAQLSDNDGSDERADPTDLANEIPGHEIDELERAVIESGSIKPIVLVIDSEIVDESCRAVLERLTRLRVNEKPIFRTLALSTPTDQFTTDVYQASSPEIFRHKDDRSGETSYQLRRLTLNEIHEYLQHHMLIFDFNRRTMFSREMAYFIADRTEGLLSEVNTLARNACTLAGMQNDTTVTMSHLLSAGLPPKPVIKKSRTLRAIKAGGFRFAMLVASLIVVLTTLWLTQS